MNMIPVLVMTFLCLSFGQNVYWISSVSGIWEDDFNWDPFFPSDSNDVIIPYTQHDILIKVLTDHTLSSLEVHNSTTLQLELNASITVTESSHWKGGVLCGAGGSESLFVTTSLLIDSLGTVSVMNVSIHIRDELIIQRGRMTSSRATLVLDGDLSSTTITDPLLFDLLVFGQNDCPTINLNTDLHVDKFDWYCGSIEGVGQFNVSHLNLYSNGTKTLDITSNFTVFDEITTDSSQILFFNKTFLHFPQDVEVRCAPNSEFKLYSLNDHDSFLYNIASMFLIVNLPSST
ncbi:hypothetical protein GEMRC1_006381 [Eukaryota sp. GEM-RC1]